ncbi:MAG: hypothetical protein JO270_21890 [Acidobacteriaceae bacterium]|nr:hypothetical protein [Acidobacteriaceae bacterium]
MTRGQKVAVGIAIFLFVVLTAGVLVTTFERPHAQPVSLEGAVIRQDFDPRARTPIPFVNISATTGTTSEQFKTDSSGFFRIRIRPKQNSGSVALRFEAPGYRPLAIAVPTSTSTFVAQMQPVSTAARIEQSSASETIIRDVRVRYSMRTTATADVGTLAKTFVIFNNGGVPCRDKMPCSPDHKWRAERGSASYDAGAANAFRDVRASCVAGPCPFTRIQSELAKEARVLNVSALSWFGTATFLVEAEVTHQMISDMIRESYPFIFGDSMSFTLPATGTGPSVEADLDKTDIVFPLGPDVVLPWADCNVRVDADKSKLYRCTVKPGYQFEY